jgi:hypothetical protein
MDFYEVVGHVLALLQRQGRVSYRALKRQFGLDDAFIEDLKEELLYTHASAVQADERGFTWTGATEERQGTTRPPAQTSAQPLIQPDQPTQVEPRPTGPYRRERVIKRHKPFIARESVALPLHTRR